jgi:hypothetical protein
MSSARVGGGRRVPRAPGLRIFSISNGYWYWGRPSLHELHLDLRAVLKKIRLDFDLHAVGLREEWERGERGEFLVEGIEPAIRYTEGKSIGIKRWARSEATRPDSRLSPNPERRGSVLALRAPRSNHSPPGRIADGCREPHDRSGEDIGLEAADV